MYSSNMFFEGMLLFLNLMVFLRTYVNFILDPINFL